MALALADRIKETTTVTSTGPATLLGASVGYQSFGVIGNGNTTYYCISDQSGSNWEVGIGTYTSVGTTLARTTVLASSNANALVNFTAGIKDVFVTYPAGKGVWADASGNVTLSGTLSTSGAITGSLGYNPATWATTASFIGRGAFGGAISLVNTGGSSDGFSLALTNTPSQLNFYYGANAASSAVVANISNTGTITSTGLTSPNLVSTTTLTLNSTTTSALTIDSTTTGAINIGTNANAKIITIGNVTGATGVVINSGTGNTAFSSGNVGIGTTAPQNMLHVVSGAVNTAGDALTTATAQITGPNVAGNGVSNATFLVATNDAPAIDVGGSIGFAARYTGTQQFTAAQIRGAKETATAGEYGGYLAFGTRIYGGQITERVRITGAGGVSFGATGTAYGTSGQVLTSAGNAAPTWQTPTVGTVTSVTGTGTVSGLTLTGTVTTTGSLTLGGTLALGSLNTLGTAAGLSATLIVGSGGTGVATLTGIPYGNATSAFTVATAAQLVTAIGASTTLVAGSMSSADKTKLDAITGTNTGNETGTTIRTALGITTLSGSNTGDQTTITGNAGTATSLAGGVAGSVPYQTAAGTTAMTAASTVAGQVLTTVTTGGAPTWVTPAGGATITDDVATNTTQYIGMSRITSGSWTSAYTASSKLYFNPSTGTTYSTVFQSLSDENKKTNINNITNALDIVENINGVTFDWKESGLPSAGLIAQDVEKYLPELVSDSEGTKSLNYNGVIGVLVEAIKELSEKIRVLEAK